MYPYQLKHNELIIYNTFFTFIVIQSQLTFSTIQNKKNLLNVSIEYA